MIFWDELVADLKPPWQDPISRIVNSQIVGTAVVPLIMVAVMTSPIAIMITTKLIMMLKVNKMSSNKGGSGTTNIAMINRTRTGKPKPAKS